MLSAFAALTAHVALELIAVERLDGGAYHAGVASAAVVGAVAGAILFATRDRAAWRRAAWLASLSAGAVVGLIVQAALLVHEPVRGAYAVGAWVTSADRALWLALGVPAGAAPAVLASLLMRLATRAPLAVPSLDEADRWIAPFIVGACALAPIALLRASSGERSVVFAAALVAAAAAALALARELRRLRWLRALFAESLPGHELAAIEDVPSAATAPRAVGAVAPQTVVLTVDSHAASASPRAMSGGAYRAAARVPLATVGVSWEDSAAPVRARCLWLAGGLLIAVVALSVTVRA